MFNVNNAVEFDSINSYFKMISPDLPLNFTNSEIKSFQ